jgi:hypothetical protein
MSRWNTKVLKEVIEKMPGTEKVTVQQQYSEYCTDALRIKPKGSKEAIFMFGFCVKREPKPTDDEVEMVEMADGTDSRGGLQSSCPKLGHLFVDIKVMMKRMGFEVVDQMKDYF